MAKFQFLLLIVLWFQLSFQNLSGEQPWGKDGELVQLRKKGVKNNAIERGLLQKIGYQLIRFHQTVISPADGPRSHFRTSSSQYTMDAIDRYGFF